jgi:iron complex outermembrane recepter protein
MPASFITNGVYASDASVIDQFTGGQYDNHGATNGGGTIANTRQPGAWYDPYNVVNLAVGYTFNNLAPHMKQLNVKLNVDNLTNNQQIIFSPGTVSDGQDLYYVLPGIAAFVSVSMPIGF